MRAQVSTTATSGEYQGFFPKKLLGVIVLMVGSDELVTLVVNYAMVRQWALDLSELISDYNLHHQ